MAQVLTKDGEIYDDGNDSRSRTIQLLIDIGGTIASVQGSHADWLGRSKEDLVGQPVTGLVNEESAILVSEILCKAALQEEMDAFVLFLDAADHQVLGSRVTGRPLQRNPDYYHLEIEIDPEIPYAPKARHSPQGLVDTVRRSMQQNGDADLDLTFVDVGDMDRLSDDLGIGDDELDSFREQVSSRIGSESLGDTVSEVASGKYGFVHRSGADLGGLQDDLKSYAADVDPLEQVLAIGTSTVSLEKG